MPVTVGPSTLTINHDRQFLISQPNATMVAQDDVGFYASDTRFVSGYGITVNGRLPRLLDAITVEHFCARYEFMTQELHLGPGSDASADGILPEGSVGFRLERTILEGVHEDHDLATRPARTLHCHALTGEARVLHPLAPVELVTSHPTLPAIWRQAVEDTESLRMVDTTVKGGAFVPAAGIPWFVTVFGRDSLVVSMESISAFPEFALGALHTLAQVQATDDDAEQDKEPGKIPHEIRSGELASLKLLPFAPYYGTADATPLFIIVLSYAYQWSGDVGLLRRYRRNAEAAMGWVLNHGDLDGDGFQEYLKRSKRGIDNQGWKDSWDAIRHADGSIAQAPIALCELQGYAFDAMLRMAEIYDLLEEPRSEEHTS